MMNQLHSQFKVEIPPLNTLSIKVAVQSRTVLSSSHVYDTTITITAMPKSQESWTSHMNPHCI